MSIEEAAKMDCREMQDRLPLYVCDELETNEKAKVEAHVSGCEGCRTALEQEQKLVEAVLAAEPVQDFENPVTEEARLLAECRAHFADALDREEGPKLWKRLAAKFGSSGWLSTQPALSAVALVLTGIVIGQTVPRLMEAPAAPSGGAPAMVISSLKSARGDKYNVEGIRFPSRTGPNSESSPLVEVQLKDDTPQFLRGPVDDPEMRTVLLKVLDEGHRYNAGLRLESVEALRTRCDEPEVRQTLCLTVRRDRNPAVRLKAIEALRSFGEDAQVRDALLEAVTLDQNPGVRVEAITALRAMAENGDSLSMLANDQRLVAVLQQLMQKDANMYVRMQSAATMRRINSRETH